MVKSKNILIVGNSVGVSTFIKIINNYNNVEKIYVTGNFLNLGEKVNIIDIREDNIKELLKFTLENDISLTVVFSTKAISADIAGIFNANGQLIFAPENDCAKYLIDKAALKKMLYKLKIKIPQFGFFDKPQQAIEYLKTASLPVLISSTTPKSEKDIYACPTVSVGNIAINDLFFRGEEKILIDKYISGHNFTTYIITDGISTLPIVTIATEKFSDATEGGFYTLGMSAQTPDFKVTQDIENYILYDVWDNISSFFEKGQVSHIGIFGISGVLTKDEVFITDICTGINGADSAVVLHSIDDNLISLFEACATGAFTDDYEQVNTNKLARISLSLYSNTNEKEFLGIEDLTEPEKADISTKIYNNRYLTKKGIIGTVYNEACTLKNAKRKLLEELEELNSNNFKYRKDILIEKDY